MNIPVEEVKKVMKSSELDANLLIGVIELQNLHQMIIIGQLLRLNLENDYGIINSLEVKELMLKDYKIINKNIRAVRHAIKFYGFGFSIN